MDILEDFGFFRGFSGMAELAPTFLWGSFLVLAIITVVLSYVLYYHFMTFGFKAMRIKKIAFIHLVVSAVLLLAASSFIQLYLNSI